MSSEENLKRLFQEWDNLNNEVGGALQSLDFTTIKDIRKKQKAVEDSIYKILKKNAPDDLETILPETCGEMEMGYEQKGKKFYFLMEDPEYADEEDLHILAITIDSNNNIETIKNFKTDNII
ncbi:MAG: hypothetical protein EU543_01910 [Promethearchaeota archaeon]|nr:MAG: hypothetical protein EU543_01910 [Candidatus Lokiarchaeota archaeon]